MEHAEAFEPDAFEFGVAFGDVLFVKEKHALKEDDGVGSILVGLHPMCACFDRLFCQGVGLGQQKVSLWWALSPFEQGPQAGEGLLGVVLAE